MKKKILSQNAPIDKLLLMTIVKYKWSCYEAVLYYCIIIIPKHEYDDNDQYSHAALAFTSNIILSSSLAHAAI